MCICHLRARSSYMTYALLNSNDKVLEIGVDPLAVSMYCTSQLYNKVTHIAFSLKEELVWNMCI